MSCAIGPDEPARGIVEIIIEKKWMALRLWTRQLIDSERTAALGAARRAKPVEDVITIWAMNAHL